MSSARFCLAWAGLAVLLAVGAAMAEDTSGGPDKSIAPNSLSGTTGASNTGSSPAATSSGVQPSDPAGSGEQDRARRPGATPAGSNNTMDDSGTHSSAPGDAPRR